MGRKKVWSIILLCIIVIYFVPMLCLCITMLDSAYDITTVGLAEAQLPGAAFIVGWFIILSMIGVSLLMPIGIYLSILCRAIAVSSIVKILSTVFLYLFTDDGFEHLFNDHIFNRFKINTN